MSVQSHSAGAFTRQPASDSEVVMTGSPSERDRLVMWLEQECTRRGVGVMELLDQIIAEHQSPSDTTSTVTDRNDLTSENTQSSQNIESEREA